MESSDKKTMKSVLYVEKGKVEYGADVKEVPTPGSGEVLIKVECAVLNPSDIYMMQGNYNGEFEYPLTPGSEGMGTVVANGGGIAGWRLVGKRVGFTRPGEKGGKFSRGGAYAEYIVTNAWQCVALPAETSDEQGACCFVNPLTAVGLLDRSKAHGAKAVIQTGAASQLGRMNIRVFREAGLKLINIVRRDEQVELLKKEHGADIVLNSTAENFDAELTQLAQESGATVALDAVAGDMPGRLLNAMPLDSVVISYGQLSEQKIGPINPITFIFRNQKIEPFLLPYWLQSKGIWGKLSALNQCTKLISTVTVSKCFGLHQVNEAIDFYKENMTAGKVFLKPSLTE